MADPVRGSKLLWLRFPAGGPVVLSGELAASGMVYKEASVFSLEQTGAYTK